MTKTTTREQWIVLCGSKGTAVDYEEGVLQAGREFLPSVARAVLDGAEPSPAYWQFLADQWIESERDRKARAE